MAKLKLINILKPQGCNLVLEITVGEKTIMYQLSDQEMQRIEELING